MSPVSGGLRPIGGRARTPSLGPVVAAVATALALLTGCGGPAPPAGPPPPTATPADAAGLPILPGLVRYEEVAAGEIDHPIRVTVPRSRNAYLWPARHAAASDGDPALPPMGLRLRLKASVDISGLPPQARVIARAMQTHGLIVAGAARQ